MKEIIDVHNAATHSISLLNNLMAVGTAAIFTLDDDEKRPNIDALMLNMLEILIKRKGEIENMSIYRVVGEDIDAPGTNFYFVAKDEHDVIDQIKDQI